MDDTLSRYLFRHMQNVSRCVRINKGVIKCLKK